MRDSQESFNPEMLVLARQSRGISQKELSELLSVSPGWLSKVEAGIKKIPEDRLSRIAELLDYPVEFFTCHKRIYGPALSEMFHRRRRNVSPRILEKHQAQIEIRRMNLEDMLQGVNIEDIDIHTYDLYEFNGKVQDIARMVRATWRLPRGPIHNVMKAIEQAKGIVIPLDFETTVIDATSCWPPDMLPLFFVNTNSPGDRLRFSLCHELGHIIMHQDTPSPYMEQQADEFAAEFLMPEDDICPYLVNLSLDKLATLKPYWKVSMAALLKRARDLGEITPRHAKTLWIQLGRAGYRTREPLELDIPVEKPTLLQEIIGVYSNEMDYTFSDLAKLFRLHEHEVCHIYFSAPSKLQVDEVRAAIEEAEDIMRRSRKNRGLDDDQRQKLNG
jgi:Zn-dependent peptidase ImmA (M78 family)